ncbi:MAG: hypothetical protein KDB71_02610 [Mycobacterium sp.]|nr:hypothetical protein [Mycobacterium sp.]
MSNAIRAETSIDRQISQWYSPETRLMLRFAGGKVNSDRRLKALLLAVCASSLLLSGCSTSAKDRGSGSETTTSTPPSTTSTPSATSTSTAGSSAPAADKVAFCRDVNTAVNIAQGAGETLTEDQTTSMETALQSASTQAPPEVPEEFISVINSMQADLQAPTTKLPSDWNSKAAKLAEDAAQFCG